MKRLLKIVVFFASFLSFSETVHVVKRGETLYSIGRQYGISLSAIKDANSLSSDTVKTGQKLSIPDENAVSSSNSPLEHTVQRGETLYSIGRQYGISVEKIKTANDLNGTNVKVGQILFIPSENETVSAPAPRQTVPELYYTAKKGDTWLGIAIDHNLTLSEILSINNVSQSDFLKEGQRVKVANVPDLKDNDPHAYATSAKKGDASLVWPVKASDVTYVNGKVSAVALSARRNESVKAIMAGTVMVAGSYRGYGNVVFVQSKTGHIYAYTGLGSVRVSKGDYVVLGEEVGTAGIDAYSQNPQVTLMVFQNSQPIDPAKAPRG